MAKPDLPQQTVRALLDRAPTPDKLREFDEADLRQLADELRAEMIDIVSKTGGHLGAGLGVVELSVALHYVFNTPDDRLIWDVGHQAYPHKILTGRREQMTTLRQDDGLSGFVRRSESKYDAFGTAHSSTSISAGLGMAVASELAGVDNNVIAVIGDGAMSAGMAYEAMNNAGSRVDLTNRRLTVVLNDNDMSIATPVGAMSAYLNRLISSRPYLGLREIAKLVAERFPKTWENTARRAEEYARTLVTGGTLFEELGFFYLGPIDGHNLEHLIPILKNVRDAKDGGPFLIHVRTQKGKGYAPAEEAADKYHGVAKFDVITGTQYKAPANTPSYTSVFAKALIAEAEQDEKIVGITAAMPSGTGINTFMERFPDRTFDVGIAEQHAVTFAAGLACEGFKPYVAVYSTFLQRGYDQLVHDVAIQNLPVRFIMDRAGYVGADGQTHHGSFDLAYLSCLPNMIIMAPSDEAELMHAVATANVINDHPSAIRYPRGNGVGVDLPDKGEPWEIGKGRIVREGRSVALLALGTRLTDCLAAADKLAASGITATVADARFAKPLDMELISQLAENHSLLVTVEEGSIGGFGAHVLETIANAGLLQNGLNVRTMTMPDQFIDHGSQSNQLRRAGLDVDGIVETVQSCLSNNNATASIAG